MARRFNQAAGDFISFNGSIMSGATSYYTIALACKVNSDSTEEVLFRAFNPGFTAGFELRRNASNLFTLYHYRVAGTVTKSTTSLTFTTADGWCVICVRVPLASLALPVVFSKTPIPNGTRVTESTSVPTDFDAGISDMDIVFTDLDVAVVGFWTGVLPDPVVDTLDKDFISWTQANGSTYFYALLYRFNQGFVTENVLNYHTVYSADQDSRSGTTVIPDPTGFEMEFDFVVRPMVVV